MITITPEAAKQIKQSAADSNTQGMALRVAARRLGDGSIDYGMGFDDTGREDDLSFKSEGINIVIAPYCIELLNGAVLDYVEIEPGEHRFIFTNPNDPHHGKATD
ncbi:MAG: iron-sulfur cluster assembly accessory protein [Chromatiales bacterium]|jgi:iron-sulfur cluster assembly protein|nr:iron-sulfur cluster assembly accessory protein [Chromatiales bacterium]MDX9766197.1 iron-sulfur cluster assembly accessory protein [Ectothiorhodospiraceae bacterium]